MLYLLGGSAPRPPPSFRNGHVGRLEAQESGSQAAWAATTEDAWAATTEDAWAAAGNTAWPTAGGDLLTGLSRYNDEAPAWQRARAEETNLLREIVGNPFRPMRVSEGIRCRRRTCSAFPLSVLWMANALDTRLRR